MDRSALTPTTTTPAATTTTTTSGSPAHTKRLLSTLSRLMVHISGSSGREFPDLLDVTLICRDGMVKWNRFLLAANSNLLKDVMDFGSGSGIDDDVTLILLPDVSASTVGSMLKCTLNLAVRNDTLSVNELEVMNLLGFRLLMEDQVRNKDDSLEEEDGLDNISLLSGVPDMIGAQYSDRESEINTPTLSVADDDVLDQVPEVVATPTATMVVTTPTTATQMSKEVKRHKRSGQRGVWICPEPGCRMKFQRRLHLERHASSHNPLKLSDCQQCGKTFSHPDHLRLHMKYHEDVAKILRCPDCGMELKGKRALAGHRESAHSSPIPCQVCLATFSSRRTLKRHVIRMHPVGGSCSEEDESSLVYCHICKLGFASAQGLMVHKRTHQDSASVADPIRDQGSGYVRCEECSKLFASRKHLTLHQRRTHQAERKECRDCGKTVKDLRKHTLACHTTSVPVTKKEEVTCYPCGTKFSSIYSLRSHQRRVHDEDPSQFKCDECDKQFVSNANLARHVREVHGENSFECDQCGQFFPVRYSLDRHIRHVHHPEKLECPMCNVSVVHLVAHLTTVHQVEAIQARILHDDLAGASAARTDLTLDLVMNRRNAKEADL